MIKTLHFRIKDSNCKNKLKKMANSVNFVWNYCNEVNEESWKKFNKTFSEFDLNNLTKDCSRDLNLHSQTIQSICKQYTESRKQFKKIKLNWRSKKSLGWIPFKNQSINIKNNNITYFKHEFKFWKSQNIVGKIKCGSFNEDSKGNWFLNLKIEIEENPRIRTNKECGIDLGLKTLITLSDGVEFTRENLTKKYEKKLAKAQRAKKNKQVTHIHTKIKNKRKDWNHKISTLLTNEYDKIVIGNVSSSKLMKTRLSKSVSDAGWYDFKQMLAYKAIKLGIEVKEVNESYSTVTCSNCKERTGPKGLSDLSVREWVCSNCGCKHFRDVNAAKNILSFSV